jgi:prolyl oligopeptidase
MKRAPHAFVAHVIALSLLLSTTFAQEGPPTVPARPVSDVYFGRDVEDPYRWLEASEDPEVRRFYEAQDAYTRGRLGRVPNRAALRARLDALGAMDPKINLLRVAGGLFFYLKTEPGADAEKLYVREGARGRERLLVDPKAIDEGNAFTTLDFFEPSPDGRYVAYGTSEAGKAETALRVVTTADGKPLADRVERVEWYWLSVSWREDSRSFYYSRASAPTAAASTAEAHARVRAYLHKLGDPVERDRPVFGFGLSDGAPVDEYDLPLVIATPGSRHVVAVVIHGVSPEISLYTAPSAGVEREALPVWSRISGPDDAVVGFAVQGDDAYLITHRDAPRNKVVRAALARPDLARAALVVPPGRAVITNVSAARDALYVTELDGGTSRLRRVDYGTARATEARLPFAGSAEEIFSTPAAAGAIVRLESWTESPRYFAVDARGRVADTGLVPRSRVDFSGITSTETHARSADGTLVPLSIVFPRGFTKDGSRAALLRGYGAYGFSLTPSFNPQLLALLERGVVFAVAHVRGGGEYGKPWHEAGMKLSKQNSIDDFVACAEHLVAGNIASPGRLAADGYSAGGILVGGAITRRPDLFAAAVVHAGDFNSLRSELSEFGPANVPEFGTFTTEEGFRSLYGMDSYHKVSKGVAYPAVFLDTGINDPSVPAWGSGKMAARLQASTSSGRPVLLRVDFAAGHAAAPTRAQRNELIADRYVFLLWQLGHPEFRTEVAQK